MKFLYIIFAVFLLTAGFCHAQEDVKDGAVPNEEERGNEDEVQEEQPAQAVTDEDKLQGKADGEDDGVTADGNVGLESEQEAETEQKAETEQEAEAESPPEPVETEMEETEAEKIVEDSSRSFPWTVIPAFLLILVGFVGSDFWTNSDLKGVRETAVLVPKGYMPAKAVRTVEKAAKNMKRKIAQVADSVADAVEEDTTNVVEEVPPEALPVEKVANVAAAPALVAVAEGEAEVATPSS